LTEAILRAFPNNWVVVPVRIHGETFLDLGLNGGSWRQVQEENMEMLRSLVGKLLPFTILCFSVGNLGCTKESPVEPNLPQLPALVDPIPFARLGQGKLVFGRIGPSGNNYSGIYVVDIDQQRSWGIDGEVIFGPSISPDGQRIAYTTYTSTKTAYGVYIMNIDGTNQQCVSDIEGQEHSPSWAFDGKQILFHAETFSMAAMCPLYRQSPEPNPHDRVLLFDFGTRSVERPVSVSSTWKIVVSASLICTMNTDGSNFKLVIPEPSRSERFYSPAWSPDGQKIALLSVLRDSMNIVSIAVVLYAADGTTPDTLVTLPTSGATEWSGDNSYSLCWSPDGSQIAFTRPDGKYVGSHIYLVRKDRTGLTQVTFAEGVTDRSLS
jgi:hypothetical protein